MINLQYVFPTAIGHDFNPELANRILPIAHEYLNKHGTPHRSQNHITTYLSDDVHKHMINDSRLNYVYDYVIEQSKHFLFSQNIDLSKLKISDNIFSFFAKVGKGSQHEPHSHPNSLLSACFYLDASEDSPPIVFYDPRPYNNFVYYPMSQNRVNSVETLFPEYSINPVAGLFLIWPAWMSHHVLLSNSDNDRIAMVFNIERG